MLQPMMVELSSAEITISSGSGSSFLLQPEKVTRPPSRSRLRLRVNSFFMFLQVNLISEGFFSFDAVTAPRFNGFI